MNVPRPDSLVQRTVQTLREAIALERIGPVLPGEPRLSVELGVSRRTLRQALDVLTREGVISAASRGRQRSVLALASGDTKGGRAPGAVVGVLLPSPVDELSPGAHDFMRDLGRNLEADGVRLSFHHSSAGSLKEPAKLLDGLISTQRIDLWVLYQCGIPVARYFKENRIPAILCGGSGFEAGLSSCAFDGIATLRHAIGVLSRAGHRRIMAPQRFPNSARFIALREVLEGRGDPFHQPFDAPVWNNEPDMLRRHLRKLLRAPDRPTGVILNGMDGVIVLFSTLLELGLSVPRDISVIVSGSDPMFRLFRPALSHYTTSHRTLAMQLAKMVRTRLRSPGTPVEVKWLLMEYVAGKSIARPPAL